MRRPLAMLLLLAAACAIPAASPSPTLSTQDAHAIERADDEAARLLGTDVRVVFRQTNATLRLIYGGQGGVDRGFDDPGLFAVYAQPASGRFAEIFVRYADLKITFSRETTDPIRR